MKRKTVVARAAVDAVEKPGNCVTCGRNPERMNSAIAECFHIECRHRRVCWSDRVMPERWVPDAVADPMGAHFDNLEV